MTLYQQKTIVYNSAGLARSPLSCYMSILLVGERAKRARHYQECTISSWCGIYMFII